MLAQFQPQHKFIDVGKPEFISIFLPFHYQYIVNSLFFSPFPVCSMHICVYACFMWTKTPEGDT